MSLLASALVIFSGLVSRIFAKHPIAYSTAYTDPVSSRYGRLNKQVWCDFIYAPLYPHKSTTGSDKYISLHSYQMGPEFPKFVPRSSCRRDNNSVR